VTPDVGAARSGEADTAGAEPVAEPDPESATETLAEPLTAEAWWADPQRRRLVAGRQLGCGVEHAHRGGRRRHRLRLPVARTGPAAGQTGDRGDGLLDPLEVGVVLLLGLRLDDHLGLVDHLGGVHRRDVLDGAVGDQHVGRQRDRGDDAATADVGTQLDLEAVLLGQPADHEQAHPAGGVDGDLATGLERLVGLGQGVARHAQTRVDDLDLDLAVVLGRLDHHRGARRRVGQRVVDELGHEVDDVRGGAAGDHPVGGGVDPDALVVLHLGDGRVDDVGDAELLEARGPAGGAAEDDQALRRTTHPGGQVVEGEQLLQALGVLLVLLQGLDEGQLLVDQRGVAAREGHEHGADLRPQMGLAGRQVDRLAVHVVDRAGQLTELLVGVDRDRGDLVGLLAVADPADGLGQLLVGHLVGAGPQLAQRLDQRAGDHQGQGQRGEQGQQDDRAVGEGARLRRGRLVGEAGLDLGDQALAQLVVAGEVLGCGTQVGRLLGGGLSQAGAVGGDQVVQPPADDAVRLDALQGLALDAELGGEPDGVEQRRGVLRGAGDEQLLLDQREARVERLDQRLRPRVGRAGGVQRGVDQLHGVAGHVAELDGGGRGDAGARPVLELVAGLEQLVDVPLLQRREVRGGGGPLQVRGGGVVGLAGAGLVVPVQPVGERGGQRQALGGVEVGDGGAEDGRVLLVGGVVAGRGQLGGHTHAAEDGSQDDRQRQHRDDLAPHRPFGHPEGREHARGGLLSAWGGILALAKFRHWCSRDSSPTLTPDRGQRWSGTGSPALPR